MKYAGRYMKSGDTYMNNIIGSFNGTFRTVLTMLAFTENLWSTFMEGTLP